MFNLVIFTCILQIIQGSSTPADETYVAAVVEFEFTLDTVKNVRNYVDYIRRAAEQDADIIVFPELALMGYKGTVHVPFDVNSSERCTPAENPASYDEILVKLSQAARDNQIYVLANIREIAHCDASTNCSAGETFKIYNTNVVFDRQGTVIDRYRKVHIYEENTFSPGSDGHIGMFDTDFGVTFGHVVCFDLLFQYPYLELIEKHKIKNIMHPSMWVSTTPTFLAASTLSAYAHALDVNILGAGGNNVTDGSAGSGIYSGKAGALISVQPTSSMSHILLANVPKVPGKIKPCKNWRIPTPDKKDLVINPFKLYLSQNTQLLVPGYQKFELKCKQNLTCTFEADLEYQNSTSTHYYRAFGFIGDTDINGKQLATGICGVTTCSTKNKASCLDMYSLTKEKQTVLMKHLKVSMTSLKPEYDPATGTYNVIYIPTSLKANKYFVPPTEYTTRQYSNGDNTTCVFELNVPQKDLASFVINEGIFSHS